MAVVEDRFGACDDLLEVAGVGVPIRLIGAENGRSVDNVREAEVAEHEAMRIFG
jgi:hypothetical protein